MSANKAYEQGIIFSDKEEDSVNIESKHGITVISASDELSPEEYKRQIERINQLMKKYEALYSGDVILSRIQRRGFFDILNARLTQALVKLEKEKAQRTDENVLV